VPSHRVAPEVGREKDTLAVFAAEDMAQIVTTWIESENRDSWNRPVRLAIDRSRDCSHLASFNRSAMRSAMATVVKWVLARGTSGMTEASITRNPVHPITRHS
jgi:hypothetical protein